MLPQRPVFVSARVHELLELCVGDLVAAELEVTQPDRRREGQIGRQIPERELGSADVAREVTRDQAPALRDGLHGVEEDRVRDRGHVSRLGRSVPVCLEAQDGGAARESLEGEGCGAQLEPLGVWVVVRAAVDGGARRLGLDGHGRREKGPQAVR